MIRIKVFEEDHLNKLEYEINKFLASKSGLEYVDLKYSVAHYGVYTDYKEGVEPDIRYTAVLVYKD